MSDKHPLQPYLEGIQLTLEHIGAVLQDINSTLAAQRTEKGTAPRPSQEESTVSGGARTTDPPKDTLMQELQPYSDYLRMDQGKVYVTEWMPDKDETKGYWRAINDILKRRDWEWVKVEKPHAKDSHWRKK